MLNQELKNAQVLTEGLPTESYYDGDSEGNTGQEVQTEAASLNAVVK